MVKKSRPTKLWDVFGAANTRESELCHSVAFQMYCSCGMYICFEIPEWIDWPKPLTFTCAKCERTFSVGSTEVPTN